MAKKKRIEDIENEIKGRGPTWNAYPPRATKSKREKEIADARKRKQRDRNKIWEEE